MTNATSPPAHAQVSLFLNSFNSIPAETLTLIQALERIRSGTYEVQVQTVRQVLAREGKRSYDRTKAHLPAVTFGGVLLPTRGNAHLQQHSGIVHGDLDHLSDVSAVKQAICADPRMVYAFISPSEWGLKLGVHVPIVADDTVYKHAWQRVSAVYEAQ